MTYFKFVKRNLRRAPYQAFAACMVTFLTFLSLSIFIILSAASQKALIYYESRPQTIAFFKDGTTPQDINAIKDALNQTGKVTNLKYVSKEEALTVYKETNKDRPILAELVTASTLPASLEISAVSPQDLGLIAQILKREPVVDEVIVPEDVIQILSNTTRIIRLVGIGVVSFLIGFATLVILMIIGFKIRLRRTEIETMRLLGASNWFIRTPFIIEGIIYGVVGTTLAWIVSVALIWYFAPWVNNYLKELALLPVPLIYVASHLLLLLLVAIAIGGLGSFSAVRRYLKF